MIAELTAVFVDAPSESVLTERLVGVVEDVASSAPHNPAAVASTIWQANGLARARRLELTSLRIDRSLASFQRWTDRHPDVTDRPAVADPSEEHDYLRDAA